MPTATWFILNLCPGLYKRRADVVECYYVYYKHSLLPPLHKVSQSSENSFQGSA